MKSMGISEFKAKCIAVLRDAHRRGTPLIITRRGEPLVRIEPIPGAAPGRRLGQLRDSTVVHGDIVRTDFPDEWEIAPPDAGESDR